MSLCQCINPNLRKRPIGSAYCGTCGFLFDYEARLKRSGVRPPDPRRIQCEAVALKIYEQLERIQSEALYVGQVQQSGDAVQGEWCIQVADIIQKELEWL